jgi:hypothetical protein
LQFAGTIKNLKGEIIRELEIHSEDEEVESNVIVQAMIMARGLNTAIVADNDNKIRIIDLETGKCKYVLLFTRTAEDACSFIFLKLLSMVSY